jgi:hypothetical protein
MRTAYAWMLMALVGCKEKPRDELSSNTPAAAAPTDDDEVKELGTKASEAVDKIKPTLESKMPHTAMKVCKETMPSAKRLEASAGYRQVAKELSELCTLTAPKKVIPWLVADMEKMKAEHPKDDQTRWCYLHETMRDSYAALKKRDALDESIKADAAKWNAVCTNKSVQ